MVSVEFLLVLTRRNSDGCDSRAFRSTRLPSLRTTRRSAVPMSTLWQRGWNQLRSVRVRRVCRNVARRYRAHRKREPSKSAAQNAALGHVRYASLAGKGIGRELLSHVLRHAETMTGLRQINLWVNTANALGGQTLNHASGRVAAYRNGRRFRTPILR